MMDIYEKLDEIIFKYNLDRHYPCYKKRKQAWKILEELFNEIIYKKKQVVFIIADGLEEKIIIHLKKEYAGISYIFYTDNFEEMEWEGIEVYLFSYKKLENKLGKLKSKHIQCFWIYDLFVKEDLIFERDFYKINEENQEIQKCLNKNFGNANWWFNSLTLELYYEKEKLKEEKKEEVKASISERCFFLALWMKNFQCAEIYLKSIKRYNGDWESFDGAWKEIQSLLGKVEKILKKRSQRDIIIYWLDALGFGEEMDMIYLNKRINESICFTNAFTVTPFTFATARAMFCGIKQIDDNGYKIKKIIDKNGSLLRSIKEAGYQCKVISGYLDKIYESDNISKYFHEIMDTSSMMYWDMIDNLLSADESQVMVVHTLDTHGPFFSTEMRNIESNYQNKLHIEERREFVKKELDNQLLFYDSLLSDNVIRIYMSDHGSTHDQFVDVHHVLFNIWDKNIKACIWDKMFTLLDFEKIIKKIMDKEKIEEKEVTREYIEIQELPFYGKQYVEKSLKKHQWLVGRAFGYKGIVSKEYAYIYSITNKEWLVKRNNPRLELNVFFDYLEKDKEELSKYRKLLGEIPTNIFKDKKFKYSRYLFQLYENEKKCLNEIVLCISQIMDNVLAKFPNNSIGIRLGGFHSKILYLSLSEKSKEKIKYFIDRDSKCECSDLNVPIISLEEALESDMQGIILSSFWNLDMLRQEAESYKTKVEVIEFYKCLEEQGIKCETDFFWHMMPDEVWDVGFPFDE